MKPSSIEKFLNREELNLFNKVADEQRITDEEALFLYQSHNLPFLAILAHTIRLRKHGKQTYFNRNFHIEPTNICIYTCNFCSFARRPGEEGGWEYRIEDIEDQVRKYDGIPITEIHIVGGVHPKRGVDYYGEMMQRIKKIRPDVHIKGFTAVELKVMFARSRMSFKEGLIALQEMGLDSLPGGGAEIFHPDIRSQICETKADAKTWLNIHETAHEIGMKSNCTILYGHMESYFHRVDHMRQLRELQDKTGGFNCYIPLKYRNENNDLSYIQETTLIEDLKNFAVSRVYLDNISHLKAYWPMIGRNTAQMSLSFGVDDMDGTIDDSTKIYSMAGAEEQTPAMTTEELVELIESAGFIAVERDSLYHVLKEYTPSVTI